ncbi:oxidoreductase FAD/NAD(P)-binding domain protein [Achlya hypogyna]|uniref:nitric oxide dioxygenase n=1 Tax=Achlya hypogyna TaxID=1202772 RepID=A0A1V9YX97_ACHHY|nr:oxidoreductase FAD/NAD(P)-binding domain protein [Achlya hypogyna]
MLSPETIRIVSATAPVVAEHAYAITCAMYKTMLPSDVKIAELFNPTHQVVLPGETQARQPAALAASVVAYASHIEDLGALTAAVERIAHKHVSLEILPEQYPVVGKHLLAAIQTVLGDAATPEIVAAWGEAYGFLADLLIGRENAIRDTVAARPGGWYGWRAFHIAKVVTESSEIKSFHLRPADGRPLVRFEPGQYVGVRLETAHFTTQRNYSLSMAPNSEEYRITVKREGPAATGCPVGRVSSYLHDDVREGDVLQVSVPCGDFYLAPLDDGKPVVLLSGGVGITPMAAMAHHLLDSSASNAVLFIHAARSREVEALRDELAARQGPNFTVKTIYGQEGQGELTGRVSADLLAPLIPDKDAHFYFCGPPGFMRTVRAILREWDVPESQVHYEYFGPFDG